MARNGVSNSSRQVIYVSPFVNIPGDTNGHVICSYSITFCFRDSCIRVLCDTVLNLYISTIFIVSNVNISASIYPPLKRKNTIV
jgi:hypothetical protein